MSTRGPYAKSRLDVIDVARFRSRNGAGPPLAAPPRPARAELVSVSRTLLVTVLAALECDRAGQAEYRAAVAELVKLELGGGA